MKEKDVIQKVINIIGDVENAKVISSFDFTEDREPFMIVVGIDTVEQLNPNLPDYRYALNITVDCFIEDDRNGELFHEILKNVDAKINTYINRDADLEVAFQEIPVVGWINARKEFSITTESNRCILNSDLIASF